jgi:hypothetical protein
MVIKNILSVYYSAGFHFSFSAKRGKKTFFIPQSQYNGYDYGISFPGLNLSEIELFVLSNILSFKFFSKKKHKWEQIDFTHNVNSFATTGFIPYSGETFVVSKNFQGDISTSYPVAVFNVNGDMIDYADDKAELITLWNGNSANQLVGVLQDIGKSNIFGFASINGTYPSGALSVPYLEINTSITLVGTSYFASFGQSAPFLWQHIRDYFHKVVTGYTSDADNNGKVAHDRIRKTHNVINGITNPDTIFFYWSVNDMMYQVLLPQPSARLRMVMKVANAQYTSLANCFSRSFNYFVDEVDVSGTSSFADTSQTFASKSFTASKNILVLDTADSYVEFTSTGKTNIVYFVSDGVTRHLGTFDIYLNGELYMSIDPDNKTVNLTGLNPTIPTVGDADASPNSVVLNLPDGQVNTIRIVNTSLLPVWLDYHSEIVTSLDEGAKPVYFANIPKFVDGIVIYGLWQVHNSTIEEANAAIFEVYNFWNQTLGAPAFLADVYEGYEPLTMMNPDALHFSQAGSRYVVKKYKEAMVNAFNGRFIAV